MQKYLDVFIESIEKKDPSILPMAHWYLSTEDDRPCAVCHMATWRLITKVNYVGVKVFDEEAGSIYAMLNVTESDKPVLLCVRMKVEDEKISEIELTYFRARADSGYWFGVDDMIKYADSWNQEIPEDQRENREFLQHLGELVYDNSIEADYESDS
ncbi:MAG: hypothetical protein HUJ76_05935, partial [Parasporobacterium sp.]|nr:hypothetical protein [Parasporobacterium sp.]